VSVWTPERRDTKGGLARGLVVEIAQSECREEQSFVDAAEIPELIRGIDALLQAQANPTSFK
jgi:hypothetical protein